MEYIATLIAKCTRKDAESVVRHFRVDADFENFKDDKLLQGEELGGLFIEFVAVRIVRSPLSFSANGDRYAKQWEPASPLRMPSRANLD